MNKKKKVRFHGHRDRKAKANRRGSLVELGKFQEASLESRPQ